MRYGTVFRGRGTDALAIAKARRGAEVMDVLCKRKQERLINYIASGIC